VATGDDKENGVISDWISLFMICGLVVTAALGVAGSALVILELVSGRYKRHADDDPPAATE